MEIVRFVREMPVQQDGPVVQRMGPSWRVRPDRTLPDQGGQPGRSGPEMER
jgi:hypothetical protein